MYQLPVSGATQNRAEKACARSISRRNTALGLVLLFLEHFLLKVRGRHCMRSVNSLNNLLILKS